MKPLSIVFVIRAAEHFSRYRSIIEPLLLRGHRLTALFDREWSSARDLVKVDAFGERYSNFRHDWLLNRFDAWRIPLFFARSLLTYRRYLVVSGQSDFFRRRWHAYLPAWLRVPLTAPPLRALLTTEAAGRVLRALEARAPADSHIVSQLRILKPDVLVSAIVGIRVLSPNVEYVKGAQALGIPAPAALVSWDSLTTKSMITVPPDISLVWNEAHVRQIMEHHGIPREQTRIVGAPVFDKWFMGVRATPREAFCAAHGLRSEEPIVLYLGAAKGTAEDETWLIRELREAFDRSSDARLRRTEIVVRPHPANARRYGTLSLPGVSVMPKGGALPDTADAFQLSLDSYTHATAAVGVFTSAMMEAMIVGKPVVVVKSDVYRETQEDAQHFKDFVASGGQEVIQSADAAAEAVSRLMDGVDTHAAARTTFVKTIIRPNGLTRPAGAIAADEIERCARSARVRPRIPGCAGGDGGEIPLR